MRPCFVVVVSALLWLGPGSDAAADRMPLPESTLCNKSRNKAHVATATYDKYMGWSSEGWRLVKPGACYKFKADAFYARGKRKLRGAGKKVQPACVLYTKVFRFTPSTVGGDGKKECKKRKGHIVNFSRVRPGKTPPPVTIVK